MNEPRDYDGPNPYMYDLNPCRCGSTMVSSYTRPNFGRPQHWVSCDKCNKHTRWFYKLIDAVHKWNEMNEKERTKDGRQKHKD